MSNIGEKRRVITVEPLEEPVPKRPERAPDATPEREPVSIPVKEPVLVPA